MICLAVSTQYWRVTDRRMDRQTSCDSIVCAMHSITLQKYSDAISTIKSRGRIKCPSETTPTQLSNVWQWHLTVTTRLTVEVCTGTDTETHPRPTRHFQTHPRPYPSYTTPSPPDPVRCVTKNSPSPLYPHNARSRNTLQSTEYRPTISSDANIHGRLQQYTKCCFLLYHNCFKETFAP